MTELNSEDEACPNCGEDGDVHGQVTYICLNRDCRVVEYEEGQK